MHGLVLEELGKVNSEGRARVLTRAVSARLRVSPSVRPRVRRVAQFPSGGAGASVAATQRPAGEAGLTADSRPSAGAQADSWHRPGLSIEAFVHAESAGAFFAQVSRVLRPGGRSDRRRLPRRYRAARHADAEDFRNGWQAHSLPASPRTRPPSLRRKA